jgi:hypothetical protein
MYITLAPKRRKISSNLHGVTLQKTEVFTVLTVMTTVFCAITSYGLVHIYHPFSETSVNFFQPAWSHITENRGFHGIDLMTTVLCDIIPYSLVHIYEYITLSPKNRYISSNLHGVTLQKTAVYKQQVDGQGIHMIFINK